MNKNVPGAKYLSTTTWATQEHYNVCCNRALFVPGAMEQNRSDLFCSRVAGTFHLLRATFFFFKQKTAYEILSGLVGSEMCIRDRFLSV